MDFKVITVKGRRPRIEILPRGIIKVVYNHRISAKRIIEENKIWIEKKLAEITKILNEYPGIQNGFLYNGKVIGVKAGRINNIYRDFVLVKDIKGFYNLLKRTLVKDLEKRVEDWSRDMRIDYNKITVRRSRKVWGSASKKGNLNFSIRLIALPEKLKEYLVIHELAHLIYMNHSRKFWILIRKYFGDVKYARRELWKYEILIENCELWQRILNG